MPVDFRWHAFTVIAIFFAFGVGILIGVALPQERVLVERQQALITRLETEFERLRSDNRRLSQLADDLRDEAREREAAVEGLAALAVAGRLADRTILVVDWGKVPGAVRAALVEMLEAAGARVVTGRVQAGAGTENGEAVSSPAPGFILDAELPPARPDGLVLLEDGVPAGAGELAEVLQSVESLVQDGIPVVLAETRGAAVTHVERFRGYAATVDQVDEPSGRVAVVFALLGAHGHYGVKETADRLLPALEDAFPALGGAP